MIAPEEDKESENIKPAEKRSVAPTSSPELHPREDLTHGDEGIDDPAMPEDATTRTTNDDGELSN